MVDLAKLRPHPGVQWSASRDTAKELCCLRFKKCVHLGWHGDDMVVFQWQNRKSKKDSILNQRTWCFCCLTARKNKRKWRNVQELLSSCFLSFWIDWRNVTWNENQCVRRILQTKQHLEFIVHTHKFLTLPQKSFAWCQRILISSKSFISFLLFEHQLFLLAPRWILLIPFALGGSQRGVSRVCRLGGAMVWSLRSFSHVGSHNSPKFQREKKNIWIQKKMIHM